MSGEAKVVRDLTQRGWERSLAQVWNADPPLGDTAPPNPLPPKPSLEAWGVTKDEASALLRSHICPACGQGPWRMVLNHAAKKHGIDSFVMRDLCGLTTVEVLVPPDLSARYSENAKTNGEGRDFAAISAMRSGLRRFTMAGLEHNTAHLAAWEAEDPERAQAAREASAKLTKTAKAQAKRSATFRVKAGR